MTEKNKTPGQILRAAREAQLLLPADIAKEMRLPVQTVDDLERDEYGNLGVRTFVRGYLAMYARILNIPQDSVLTLFDATSPMPEIVPSYTSAAENAPVVNVTRERAPFRYPPKVLIGFACAIFVLFALIFHSGKTATGTDVKKEDSPSTVSSVEQPIVIPAETTAALPSSDAQKTASLEVEKAITPKAVVSGQANPGTNTPFVRKAEAHVAAAPKTKAPVHATYTVSPVTSDEKAS